MCSAQPGMRLGLGARAQVICYLRAAKRRATLSVHEDTISIAVPYSGIWSTGCGERGISGNVQTCTAREPVFFGNIVAFLGPRKCASSILRGGKRSMGHALFRGR